MYLCGLDIGGTFTDCVIVDDHGRVVSAKAPSTPGDFAEGLMHALEAAARKCGQPVSALLSDTALVLPRHHGRNERDCAEARRQGGARHHPRAQRRHPHHAGLARARRPRGAPGGAHPGEQEADPNRSQAPDPGRLRARGLLRERGGGAQRVAGRAGHPRAARAGRGRHRHLLPVVVSGALARAAGQGHGPGPGPGTLRDLLPRARPEVGGVRTHDRVVSQRLRRAGDHELSRGHRAGGLRRAGYRAPLQITQSAGGTIPVEVARRSPLLTLDSGPVAGVMGSRHSASAMGYENVITTDMGGTSFDIGVIHEGEPAYAFPQQGAPVRVLPAQGRHPGHRQRRRQHGPDRTKSPARSGWARRARGRSRDRSATGEAATCPR